MQMYTSSMSFDDLASEVVMLKHNTSALRNENNEIKQYITNLNNFRFEITKEVRLLKDSISQLMEQQALFGSSQTALIKDVKNLLRENFQIKSKCDIFQLRLKSLQDRDPGQRSVSPIRLLEGAGKQNIKDDEQDFQLSPRLENILNKGTKDRLENLKKDLEDVFKKPDERFELAKGDKDTIMDNWSCSSDLNFSESNFEKSQTASSTNFPGELGFNIEVVNGQPASLMEQVEMLNLAQNPQKISYGDESVFDNNIRFGYKTLENSSSKGGDTPRPSYFKKESTGRLSPYSGVENSGVNRSNSDRESGLKRSDSFKSGKNKEKNINKEGEGSARIVTSEKKPPSIKKEIKPQVSYSSAKMIGANVLTPSTTLGATQNSFMTSETHSSFPTYRESQENYLFREEASGRNYLSPEGRGFIGQTFQESSFKPKNDFYYKGDNMLVTVLDKFEEKNKTASLPLTNTQQFEGKVFGYSQDMDVDKIGNTFVHRALESLASQDNEKTNTSDISITFSNGGTASKGTKRLKLVRKGAKAKDDTSSVNETNRAYDS